MLSDGRFRNLTVVPQFSCGTGCQCAPSVRYGHCVALRKKKLRFGAMTRIGGVRSFLHRTLDICLHACLVEATTDDATFQEAHQELQNL